MSKRMLIDASHPEETRVVVLDGHKVEEFDFESASKRPLKGNIYLAKVTRVEPSLQAAFIEYGGNRQGFLAFSEIHPDYYQIPIADRQALIAEQEAEARRRSEDDIESFEISSGPKSESTLEDDAEAALAGDAAEPLDLPSPDEETGEETDEAETLFVNHPDMPVESEESETPDDPGHVHDHLADPDEDATIEPAEAAMENEGEILAVSPESDAEAQAGEARPEAGGDGEPVPDEAGQGEDSQALHMQRPAQKWVRRKHYKIQEVIKRRQIILVQVVKEERGNKGAALTTYLSLAGRYCVLMPNTPRGGGISRKITNAADRKRLKSAAQALELPEGMGLIIRTAGENRTKIEIKRDYEYLLRLWDTIREKTLSSNAPACVYEEGDLIKRVIRDLYTKDVSDITVEGEEGYRNAKDFMRMLMPSHAKNVVPYNEAVPLFQRQHIEAQLDAMFSPTVTLKSGGYIVINQTEALVSVDVNSGRATREHSIEETARKTNLEAADEVGRQLRLRDLAGLIVIDFIDMEESRNDREVEKRMRDAVKNDRARVQIGKISQFGLLEMSRQRLRAGVVAGSTIPCPHCGGQGIVRSVESTALRLLRALEEEGEKNHADAVTVRVAGDVAIYTLNQKRRELARIEAEYGMEISFEPKEGLLAGTFDLERTKPRDPRSRPRGAISIEAGFTAAQQNADEDSAVADEEEEDETEADAAQNEDEDERPSAPSDLAAQAEGPRGGNNDNAHRDGAPRKRRRRRGGRGRGNGNGERPAPAMSEQPQGVQAQTHEDLPSAPDAPNAENQGENGQRRKRRRRGRRGGRDRARPDQAAANPPATDSSLADSSTGAPAPRPYSSDADRFGLPDEIDTTPREEPRDPGAQTKPIKKGWWQRAFSGE
jgi:ribonuclease E